MIPWLILVALAPDVPGQAPRPGVPTPIEDASGHALDAFYRSLARTAKGEGQTRILQFGASHTAADLFTGRVRRRLQKRFGDAGHGFLMPAKPWDTYRHQDVVFETPLRRADRWHWDFVRLTPECHTDGYYGLAGMSILARSKRSWARFHLSEEGRYGTRASRFQLYFMTQPDGGDLIVSIDGKARRIKTRGPLGLGEQEVKLADRGHAFELRPRGNGEVRLYGAVLERTVPGVVLDTLGINGSRVRNLLQWNEALWTDLVRRRDPALVVLAYGTNEAGDLDTTIAEYRRDLHDAVARVRRAAPAASCVLVGPSDRPQIHKQEVPPPPEKGRHKHKRPKPSFIVSFSLRTRAAEVIQAQREVARELGCGFWDTVAASGGPFSIVSWVDREPPLAWPDYVHFTRKGYRRLGDLFTDALLAGFPTK